MQKDFKSNGQFWILVIKLEDREVLFYKNGETDPFYYFSYEEWLLDHTWIKHQMKDKTWFTDEMYQFIDKNIQP